MRNLPAMAHSLIANTTCNSSKSDSIVGILKIARANDASSGGVRGIRLLRLRWSFLPTVKGPLLIRTAQRFLELTLRVRRSCLSSRRFSGRRILYDSSEWAIARLPFPVLRRAPIQDIGYADSDRLAAPHRSLN